MYVCVPVSLLLVVAVSYQLRISDSICHWATDLAVVPEGGTPAPWAPR